MNEITRQSMKGITILNKSYAVFHTKHKWREVRVFPGGAIALVVGPCPSVPPDAHSFRARASWRQTGRECYIEMGGATPEGPSTPVGTVLAVRLHLSLTVLLSQPWKRWEKKRDSRINARLCNHFVIIPILPLKLLLLFTLLTTTLITAEIITYKMNTLISNSYSTFCIKIEREINHLIGLTLRYFIFYKQTNKRQKHTQHSA